MRVVNDNGFPRCYFRDIKGRTCSISDDDGDMWFKDVQKNIYQIIVNGIELNVDKDTYNDVYDWKARKDNVF